MQTHEILNQLDELIASRSILKHPFYQAWQAGELSRDQLAHYARIYYPHVAAFPDYLRSAIDSAQEPAVRAELEANLEDELSHPTAHNELWLDFAAGLGMDREEVRQADPHPSASQIVSQFMAACHAGSAEALAALYAYESQQPEVSGQKIEGLKEYYGIQSPEALAYFQVHATADLEHRAGERNALAHCLENGATPESVMESAGRVLESYWSLLDGICEQAGVLADC